MLTPQSTVRDHYRHRVVQAAMMSLLPSLIAAVPLLHLWALNAQQVGSQAVLRPLLATVGLQAVLMGGFLAVRREIAQAGLAAALSSIGLVTFGNQLDVAAALLPIERVWLIGLTATVDLVLAYLALRWAWRLQARSLMALQYLAAVAVVLNAFALGSILTADRASADSLEQPRGVSAFDLPDIYYIVLDGYAREDVLNEIYGYDNRPFTDELEQRGFFVADRAYANYAHTQISLASSLNMRYVDELPATLSGNVIHLFEPLLTSPRIVEELRARGYKYVHFDTPWWGTDAAPLADVEFDLGGVTEFEAVYFSKTLIGAVFPTPTWQEQHLRTLEHLPDVAAMDGPTFAFAHVLLPHPPFVFDQEGNIVRREAELGGDWEDTHGHLAQLQFTNRFVLSLIDGILANSADTPIIVLQSDHGPGWAIVRDVPLGQWERMAILDALLVPTEIREELTPVMTPVNTFRIILRNVLGADLPTLPDKMMFSWPEMQESFVDVTATLDDR